jgi:hypothetical protein
VIAAEHLLNNWLHMRVFRCNRGMFNANKTNLSAQDRVNWQTAAIVLARIEGSAVTQLPRSSQKIVANCEQKVN